MSYLCPTNDLMGKGKIFPFFVPLFFFFARLFLIIVFQT